MLVSSLSLYTHMKIYLFKNNIYMPKCNFLTVPTSQELLLRKMLRIPSLCAFESSWCSQHLDSVTWTPALLSGHSSLPPRMMVVGILFFPSKKKIQGFADLFWAWGGFPVALWLPVTSYWGLHWHTALTDFR